MRQLAMSWSRWGLAGGAAVVGLLWSAVTLAGPLTLTPSLQRVRIAEGETQSLRFTIGNGTASARLFADGVTQEPFAGDYSFAAGHQGNMITGVTVTNLATYRGKTLGPLGSDQVSLQVATGAGGTIRPLKPQTATWNVRVKGWSRPSTGGPLVEDVSPEVAVEVFDLIKGGDISGGLASTDFGTGPSGTAGGPGTAQVTEQTLGWSLTLAERRLLYGLGIWDEGNDGLASPHAVGLWSELGGVLLASAILDNSAQTYASSEATGSWRFQRLQFPLWLDPGTYVLGAHYLSNGTDAFRYSTPTDPLTFTPSNGVTFGTSRRVSAGATSGTGLMFPDEVVPDEVGRFGPNLLLAPVPEPGVLGLCLAAVVWGVGGRWLRQHVSSRPTI